MSDLPDRRAALLAERIAALDEPGSLNEIRACVERGDDAVSIIVECQRGMRFVGEHYSAGRYYISGLIMAGEIFRQAMTILGPLFQDAKVGGDAGSIVLCTVRGDIHDLGKEIVAMMLRSYGIAVHDLGVDVAPAEVAAQARRLRPDIVGLSCLLTIAMDGMKETVAELREVAGELDRELPVIIGGGPVDEQTCRYTGADLWADDAAEGVRLIRGAIAARRC